MNRGGLRSLALLSVFFVFALLLVSGGPRLIGHANEYDAALTEVSVPLCAVLSRAPQRPEETGLGEQGTPMIQRRSVSCVSHEMRPQRHVVSDANGNVIRCQSYLRAVYQAFSLGDGFV